MMDAVCAHDIYDILVHVCGANPDSREYFVQYVGEEHDSGSYEWRFMGRLGFGGKFYMNLDNWRVDCYREDSTPERRKIIEWANEAIREKQHLYAERWS